MKYSDFFDTPGEESGKTVAFSADVKGGDSEEEEDEEEE